jgi:TetR/AcrR family transcriptional repressor of nem operon
MRRDSVPIELSVEEPDMPRDGTVTRERILSVTLDLVLGHGFNATSVDKVIERAGITKGTFFYHFKTKADLARALVERFAVDDEAYLVDFMARAEKLSRDPLQQLLIFVGLFEEMVAELTEPYPGCLYASFIYEAQLMEAGTLHVIDVAIRKWRDGVGAKLREIAAIYPPKIEVDLDSLADELTVVFEGAYIVSKTLNEPNVVARQLAHYKNYLELLFSPHR